MISYIKDLKKEFSSYNSRALTSDVFAALHVVILALPLSFAYGISTGLGALAGVLSALISGIVMTLISGNRFHISAPTASLCAVLITISSQYGLKGILFSGLLAGIIMIFASFLHIGRLISYIPVPVFTGFTSGVAIVFALGQIDHFFAVTSQGSNIIEKFISYGELGFSPNLIAMMFGFLSIAIMLFWPNKLKEKCPSSLAALLITLIINMIFNMDVPEIGHINARLTANILLSFQDLTLDNIIHFFLPAISIAALCIIESSINGSLTVKQTGENFSQERELLGQGIGNIILPFFGAVPATANSDYTRANIQNGAVSRLSSVFQGLIITTLFFILAPFLARIPLSAVAGVLIVTSFRMNNWKNIRSIFKKHFASSLIQFFITMLLTVFVDLTIAIVLGITISMFIFVARNCDLRVEISDIDTERLHGTVPTRDFTKTKLIYLTGPLFFGTQDKLSRALNSIQNTDAVILSMRGVPSIDPSAIRIFEDIIDDYHERGIHLMFCGVQPVVKTLFDRTDITDKIGADHFFWDAIAAMKAMK